MPPVVFEDSSSDEDSEQHERNVWEAPAPACAGKSRLASCGSNDSSDDEEPLAQRASRKRHGDAEVLQPANAPGPEATPKRAKTLSSLVIHKPPTTHVADVPNMNLSLYKKAYHDMAEVYLPAALQAAKDATVVQSNAETAAKAAARVSQDLRRELALCDQHLAAAEAASHRMKQRLDAAVEDESRATAAAQRAATQKQSAVDAVEGLTNRAADMNQALGAAEEAMNRLTNRTMDMNEALSAFNANESNLPFRQAETTYAAARATARAAAAPSSARRPNSPGLMPQALPDGPGEAPPGGTPQASCTTCVPFQSQPTAFDAACIEREEVYALKEGDDTYYRVTEEPTCFKPDVMFLLFTVQIPGLEDFWMKAKLTSITGSTVFRCYDIIYQGCDAFGKFFEKSHSVDSFSKALLAKGQVAGSKSSGDSFVRRAASVLRDLTRISYAERCEKALRCAERREAPTTFTAKMIACVDAKGDDCIIVPTTSPMIDLTALQRRLDDGLGAFTPKTLHNAMRKFWEDFRTNGQTAGCVVALSCGEAPGSSKLIVKMSKRCFDNMTFLWCGQRFWFVATSACYVFTFARILRKYEVTPPADAVEID